MGQPMDLHRFWDGVITSSQNLTPLRNDATTIRNRQEFQRSQLTQLANTDFESWVKESFEIATKIATVTGGRLAARDRTGRQGQFLYLLFCDREDPADRRIVEAQEACHLNLAITVRCDGFGDKPVPGCFAWASL